MTAQLERELLSRLDLSSSWRGLPSDRPLSGFQGRATAALAVEAAGFISRGDLSSLTKRAHARRHYVTAKALPEPPSAIDPEASERARKMRAGVRWSDSPSAVRSRTERARLAQKRVERGQA